jgi:uncharacterized protein (TIGR00369 family)
MDKKGLFWEVMEGKRPRSPSGVLLGWKLLDVNADEGTIRVQFEAKPEFLNPTGNVQGGLLAAMLDHTLGPVLGARLGPGELLVTLSLNANFIAPACPGLLIGEGRVVSMGKSVCFLEGKLTDANGGLVATATSTARIVKIKSDLSFDPDSHLIWRLA